MARLSCNVSKHLLDEIKRIQIVKEFKSRGDTLEYLIGVAIDNIGDTVNVDEFGKHNHKECYVELKKKKFEDTAAYRRKYLLTGKREFLLHAVCHGVNITKADKTFLSVPIVDIGKIEQTKSTVLAETPSSKNPTNTLPTKDAAGVPTAANDDPNKSATNTLPKPDRKKRKD